MKIIITALFVCFSLNTFASVSDKVKKLDWSGVEVIWLEDERFPTYLFNVYFADGALSDDKGYEGETAFMFDLLDSGTRRYPQKDIVDNLEFYGVDYGGSATHEYSTFRFSGLVKDILPTVKQICHIFNDATFPKNIINKELKRAENGIKNLLNSPGGLASRAFRELSLSETSYSYPSQGKLRNLKKFSEKRFRKKLKYFNEKVKKRIYIAGPKRSLIIEKAIKSDCNWQGTASFVRTPKTKMKKLNKNVQIHLVTVPQGNQAQIRMGRFLNESETANAELKSLVSEYLGGGFTSQLMREARVKKGLTYGIGSYIGSQKYYGRAMIMTSTRNEKVEEMLLTIKEVLGKLNKGTVIEEDFVRARGALAGSYPFRFERLESFLGQLLIYDHIGRNYNEIYGFQDKVNSFEIKDIVGESKLVFDWDQQTIVVLGPKSLLKQLKKLGKVQVHSYKKFL